MKPFSIHDLRCSAATAWGEYLKTKPHIYEIYGRLTGIQLSTLTHTKGSPWYETWGKDGKNAVISNDLIEEYYKNLAEKTRIP